VKKLNNKKGIFLKIFFFLFLTLYSPVVSASEESLESFVSENNINSDGTLLVKETIVYNPGNEERHGLFRKIDFKKINMDNKKFILGIDILRVTDENGNSYKYSQKKSGQYIELKIGDPDRLINSPKTYVIEYKVSGAVTYFTDHDELYRNLTENNWTVPIKNFNASISFPNLIDEESLKYICYEGPDGSTSQSCIVDYSEGKVNVSSSRVLSPGEGVTAIVSFPKGIVEVLEPKPDRPGILFIIFYAFLGILGLFWYLFLPLKILIQAIKEKNFTKKHEKIVSAWFQPPEYDNGEGFSPAETGFIVDKKIDHRELTATIIHLAQRGYLKIKETKKNHFTFIKLKSWESGDIKDFEKEVLEAIFENGDEVEDKDLKKSTTLFGKISKFNKYVESAVVDKGMFEKKPTEVFTKYVIFFSMGVATMNIFLSLVSILFGSKMAKRTLKGIEKYSEARSLLNFLKSQDEQLNFQSNNQMFFEKLLPYAAAFGVEKIWAERFKDISLAKPDWYEGENFSNSMFIGNMTHNIGGSMKSAHSSSMSSTRSSSGFSSGFSGGSSGGSGGSGGGGGW
jgi:uncharacterized membrane protein